MGAHGETIGGLDYSPGNARCEDYRLMYARMEADDIREASYPFAIADSIELFSSITAACGISPEEFGLSSRRLSDLRRDSKNPATGCSEIDPPRNLPPIRDQGTVGCCFSYTAADLLSVKLGSVVSALDLAIAANMESSGSASASEGLLCNGGDIGAAIDSAKSKGICDEKNLPSTDMSQKQEFRDIQESFDRLAKLQLTVKASDGVDPNCQEILPIIEHFFPNQNLKDLLAVVQESNEKTLLAELADNTCQDRKKVPRDLNQTTQGHSRLALQKIHEKISKGVIVGISYDSNFLREPKDRRKNAQHASSIVGRRWNTSSGKCELLLRNSWGPSCEPYKNEYKSQCKNGSVWIPSEDLEASLVSSTWLN